MHSLPLFLKLAGRTAILIGTGDAAAAKHRLLERAGALISDDPDAPDAALAVVALDNRDEAAAAAARLKARGLIVNVVDQPDLCDFTTPAMIDRDPLIVAIGTGGASAGLAKAVRQRIEALLPADLGDLALRLSALRGALRQRLPDGAARRRLIDAGLLPGGPLDPLLPGRAAQAEAWLVQGQAAAPDAVHHIRIASADPDDLTLRQARLLGLADIIVHGRDVPAAILARARADAVRIAGDAAPADAQGLVLVLAMAHDQPR